MCCRIRFAVIGALLCLAMVCAAAVIVSLEQLNIGLTDRSIVIVWLCASLGGAIPCLGAAAVGWRVSSIVARDKTFSVETAKLLSFISTCAYVDAAYGFAANIIMGFLGFQHPSVLIVSCALILLALAAGTAFAALARLVQKAADLQEESDYTV
jgi:hypothetical protein